MFDKLDKILKPACDKDKRFEKNWNEYGSSPEGTKQNVLTVNEGGTENVRFYGSVER